MVLVNIGLAAMYLDLKQMQDVLKSTQTVLAGSSAVVAQYCREIKLPEILKRLALWDHSRKGVSAGTLIQALAANILEDRRAL